MPFEIGDKKSVALLVLDFHGGCDGAGAVRRYVRYAPGFPPRVVNEVHVEKGYAINSISPWDLEQFRKTGKTG